MRNSCLLGFLFSLVVLCAHGAPPIPKNVLNLPTNNADHGFEAFWVDSLVVFLLTNDQTGEHDLYRSVDGGMHWIAQSTVMPNPSGCYVERIYQDIVQPQQLYFFGPPQSACGWQTFNGGQSYNYISVPAEIQWVSVHPNITGWALAETSDTAVALVYFTQNMGSSWELLNATAATWVLTKEYSAVPLPSIYMIRDGTFGYSWDMGASFSPIQSSSVHLYTSANFIYVLSTNRTLTVGRNKDNFNSAVFPFGSQVQLFTVTDDMSGATWFLTDASYFWGNLYIAGASGALYIESLQHVLKRDDALLDFHSVRGLPGVHLANVVVNYDDFHDLQLITYITYDNGGSWNTLTPPPLSCSGCSLNLYFNYNPVTSLPMYSSPNTIGVILANGAIGGALSYDNPINLNPYLSRDAGLTWEQLVLPTKGAYLFQFGSHGGVLILAPKSQATSVIYYSLDEGKTIVSYSLTSDFTNNMWVTRIIAEPTGTTSSFFLYLTDDVSGYSYVYSLDFSNIQSRTCVTADYETWIPSDGNSTNPCWLGQQVTYSRRIRDAACTDTRGEQIINSQICQCTLEDYECDFGYGPKAVGGLLTCVVVGTLPPDPPVNCTGSYDKTQGFRLVPGDVCTGGLDLRPKTNACPKPTAQSKPSSKAWVAGVVVVVVFVVLCVVAFIIYRDPTLREKILSVLRPRSGRYNRVKARSNSLAGEEDFGIHDDLLEDGGEEEDAKVLHDHDISKASSNRS